MRGRDKLLEEIDGEPLLRRQARAALETGHPVLVLLPSDSPSRAAALKGLDVSTCEVPDATTGMSASLRIAAEQAEGHDALAILLPDVPGMACDDLCVVIDAYRAHRKAGEAPQIHRATDPEGRPGTPTIFPNRYFRRFAELTGDEGGRSVLSKEKVVFVAFPDDRATLDLDTPEDWAAYRHRR